jgi:hypothetical protein
LANEKKQTMIDQESRPTAIDYDAPLADLKIRDLLSIVNAHLTEQFKHVNPELFKPEKELRKPEKELYKPEKEFLKPEFFKPELLKPEYFKPELLKPELLKPEYSKQGPEIDPEQLVEDIAAKVVSALREQGIGG